MERSTRFVLLLHLPNDHGAEAIQDAIVEKMADLPAQLRRSLTWDQGSEMAGHAAFSLATAVDVYFAHPHSPWERGTNENTNGLLREYFPKGTDITDDQAYLDLRRPRAQRPPTRDTGLENTGRSTRPTTVQTAPCCIDRLKPPACPVRNCTLDAIFILHGGAQLPYVCSREVTTSPLSGCQPLCPLRRVANSSRYGPTR